jgi:hypothetical protein
MSGLSIAATLVGGPETGEAVSEIGNKALLINNLRRAGEITLGAAGFGSGAIIDAKEGDWKGGILDTTAALLGPLKFADNETLSYIGQFAENSSFAYSGISCLSDAFEGKK